MPSSPTSSPASTQTGPVIDLAQRALAFDTALTAIAVQSSDGRIVDCNPEAARLLGMERADILGRDSFDLRWGAITPEGKPIAGEDHPGFKALRTGRRQHGMTIGVRLCSGKLRWLLVNADAFEDGEGRRFAVSSFMDVSAQLRLEAWQALTLSLVDRMARRAPLHDLLMELVAFVEHELLGARCSLQLLSDDGLRLQVALSPSLPTAYLHALAGLEIGPTAGSCGAAAALGHTIIIPDVLGHPNWAPYRFLAEQHGFRACWSEPVFDEARRVIGTFAVYYDGVREPEADDLELLQQSSSLAALVLERCRARENMMLAGALFEQGSESVVVTDAAHRIVRVNPAFEKLTGYAAREILGQPPTIVHAAKPQGQGGLPLEEGLAADGRWQGELLLRRKTGEVVPVWLTVVAVRDAHGAVSHYLRTAIDLSEAKAQAERIRQLAFFDPLTSLPNRALVIDRLRQAISSADRRQQSLAVIFVDLNRFKEVNDTLGHAMGDEVLVAVGQRFAKAVRRDDTLGRMGGDEFIVIADGANEAEATVRAERLMECLADPILVREQPFALGASIGVALYPADGLLPDELMKHADIAMYRAKSAGGGIRLYQPEMSSGLGERVALARDLRYALKRRDQLALHFQPQFDLATGALSGAEALVRWTHPGLGPISPSTFIPLAEERAMILDLSDWVLQAACAQLAAWRREGRGLPGRLAINFSAHQLDVADALTRTMRVLRVHGVDPAELELELTESALMRNIDHAMKAMHEFREAGMALAIDDFGMGYSSLSYLKRFPVERLKIDMSFVRDMLRDRNDFAIVGSIVAMAKPLNLGTVAEGVEHESQAAALRELGCDHAQGYLFGPPVGAAPFAERWLPPAPKNPGR